MRKPDQPPWRQPVLRAGGSLILDDAHQLILVLVPLDEDASESLKRALSRAEVPWQSQGEAVTVLTSRLDLSALAEHLLASVAGPLLGRVKGVLSDVVMATAGDGIDMSRAEPLTVVLDQVEVAWAAGALSRNAVHSVYQPIVSVSDGVVAGYEALIRARRPDTGEEVGAGQLIYACQRLNRMHDLDHLGRQAAIDGAASMGLGDRKLFINLLPDAVYDPEVCLAPTVEDARRGAIPLSHLVFEVAQVDAPRRKEHLTAVVGHCRELGASVALDNIGAGASSFEFIADLRPDYVKLDSTLVAEATASNAARRTLDSVVALSRGLNMKVVAEGVETNEQLTTCLEAGADYAQGYLFARPAFPPAEVNPAALKELSRAA